MGKFRFLIVVLVVLGIAGFTSWLLRSLDEQKLEQKIVSEYEADYFLEGFIATALDPAGNPSYRLEAEQLKHFPISTMITLQKPYVEFYGEHPKPWQTWAEHGTINQRIRRMELTGKVRIHRAASKNEPSLTLHTETLFIDTREKLAETDADVQIIRGKNIITATGMRIDMLKDRLELLSKVQGKYEVPQR